jgi:hypothetical protein
VIVSGPASDVDLQVSAIVNGSVTTSGFNLGDGFGQWIATLKIGHLHGTQIHIHDTQLLSDIGEINGAVSATLTSAVVTLPTGVPLIVELELSGGQLRRWPDRGQSVRSNPPRGACTGWAGSCAARATPRSTRRTRAHSECATRVALDCASPAPRSRCARRGRSGRPVPGPMLRRSDRRRPPARHLDFAQNSTFPLWIDRWSTLLVRVPLKGATSSRPWDVVSASSWPSCCRL